MPYRNTIPKIISFFCQTIVLTALFQSSPSFSSNIMKSNHRPLISQKQWALPADLRAASWVGLRRQHLWLRIVWKPSRTASGPSTYSWGRSWTGSLQCNRWVKVCMAQVEVRCTHANLISYSIHSIHAYRSFSERSFVTPGTIFNTKKSHTLWITPIPSHDR